MKRVLFVFALFSVLCFAQPQHVQDTILQEVTAPATPSPGFGHCWFDATTHAYQCVNASGTVTQMSSGAPGANADMVRSSTTSVALATGAGKSWTYTVSSTNLGWTLGMRLRASHDSAHYEEGVVTTVSGSAVTLTVDNVAGSGTFTSWTIGVAGDVGAAGTAGLPADMVRTSTTSNALGTGIVSWTFTTPSSNLGWTVGTRLRAYANSSNYAEGLPSTISGSGVAINVDRFVGSGTWNAWNITVAGDVGPPGPTGTFPTSLGSGASGISITVTAGAGGVTANYLAAKDTTDPTRYVIPSSGGCGSGIAATTQATAGQPFELYVVPGAVLSGVADNAWTAGHILVGGTATPGRIKDYGVTSRALVPSTVCIVGVAQAGTSLGATGLFRYDGSGTWGSLNDAGAISNAGTCLGTAASTSTVQVCATSPALTSNTYPLTVSWVPYVTSGASPTLNAGGGALPILTNEGVAAAASLFTAAVPVTLSLNSGATAWVAQPLVPSSTGATATGPIAGNVTGNASGSSRSFTGSLAGDVTGTQGATSVGMIHDVVCPVNFAASPYTVVSTCSYIYCDATGGAVVINLPAATGSGREITTKKIDSSANACTPTHSGSDLIDGAASYNLSVQWASSKIADRASGVWDRSHVNQLVGDVSGISTANTVNRVNGVAFSGLATGFLFNTITTGVPSVPTAIANTVLAGPTTGAAAVPTMRALVATDIPVVPMVSGTGGALAGPDEFYVCTTTCTVTPPVPVAGYQFCVRNAPGVSTVITLAGVALVYYEKTDNSGYGTVATAATSGGTSGDKICYVGLDSTHYLMYSYVGTWTVN